MHMAVAASSSSSSPHGPNHEPWNGCLFEDHQEDETMICSRDEAQPEPRKRKKTDTETFHYTYWVVFHKVEQCQKQLLLSNSYWLFFLGILISWFMK